MLVATGGRPVEVRVGKVAPVEQPCLPVETISEIKTTCNMSDQACKDMSEKKTIVLFNKSKTL